MEAQITNINEDIIPRWEWRTFDISQEEAKAIFQNEECYRTMETTETYFISKISNSNLKVRHNILDMKIPLRIDNNKLELWTVAHKAELPLSIHNFGIFFFGIGVPLPKLENNIFSLEEFLELVKKTDFIQTIEVAKIRHGFRPNGVRSELASTTINNKTYTTISFENEDQNKVWELVTEHGLTSKQNTNYIKFLKDKIGIKY